MIEYRVLGPVEVRSGETTVDIGGPKPRALLAHLIASANEVVSTDALIDRMWGEEPPASAANTLQTYVSRLRGVLGSDVIESTATGYRLVAPPDAIDALSFEVMVAQGRAALASDAAMASRTLQEAADLWRGHPYEGIAGDGALTPEVTRLEELKMAAVEDRITADIELGNHGVLTGEIEALLEEHPYRERLWGLLMTALVRSGRQADALRAYQRARLILGDELGIEPSPELREIEDQILLQDEALRTVPEPTDLRNPFKGLAAFKEDDAADFFGRSHLVEELLDHVRKHRFLAVVGPSGSGKSSAVRAGLIPALREGRVPGSGRWLIAQMIPGAHPFAELEGALLRAAPDPPASLMEQLRDEELGLLRASLRILPDDDTELVLLVDQFEELFTLVASEDTRQRFLRSLRLAVETPHSRVRVIVTLRADFYDRPMEYGEFGKLFVDRVVHVLPLTTHELEEAVVGPADRAGVAVEPVLLADLIADVASQPGTLPLFQYTLTELFGAREDSELTSRSYEKIGGVHGALAGRADAIYDRLSPTDQHAARQLFLRLVAIGEHGEDSRRRVATAELDDVQVDPGAMQRAIDTFAEHRLLTFDRNPLTGTPTVEVAHEALLRQWPRLQEWVQEGRSDLRKHLSFRRAVDEWLRANRNEDYLLTRSRLALYEGWADETELDLTTAEREFLDAGLQRREAEDTALRERQDEQERLQRRARSRLVVAASAVIIALSVVGAVVFAVLSQGPKITLISEDRALTIGSQVGVGWDQATDDFDFRPQEVAPVTSARDDIIEAAEAGSDLIITVGIFRSLEALEVAPSYPDQLFVGVDVPFPRGTGDNVVGMTFADEEGSFLVGAAAALTSETGKLGFIGGADMGGIQLFEAGFVAGARTVDPSIDVTAVYLTGPDGGLDGFSSPNLAFAVATKMYVEDDIDVIFSAAGGSGFGTLQAAADATGETGAQRWTIGVDRDERLLYADRPDLLPHILTSMLKKFDVGVYRAVQDYVEGRLQPGPMRLTLADGGVAYARTGSLLSAEIADQVDVLASSVASGEIEVPSQPEMGSIQAPLYLGGSDEVSESNAVAFRDFIVLGSSGAFEEARELTKNDDVPLGTAGTAQGQFEYDIVFNVVIGEPSCEAVPGGARCSYTVDGDIARAVGAAPGTRTLEAVFDDGKIVSIPGIEQPPGPGTDFFNYLLDTYFDDLIQNCQNGPDTVCGEFAHTKLDEWAEQYLAAQG